jgi:hypothetical protein
MATNAAKPDGEAAVLAVIEEMPEPDRTTARALHEMVMAAVPELSPRLWYTQPAYAKGGPKGKVVVFFRSAAKDGERYFSFGFSSAANLDDGNVWPTSYAVTELTPADAERLTPIVRQAAAD